MHDQSRRRTLSGRFFIFIGPAAIVGHGIAIEEFGVLGGIAGIVDQYDHRLAGDVYIGIVVPVTLWRNDAVADENHIAALHRDIGDLLLRPHHHLIAITETGIVVATLDLQDCIADGGQFGNRNCLEIRVAIARGYAQGFELLP